VEKVEQGERRIDLVELIWFCRAMRLDPVKTTAQAVAECLGKDGFQSFHRKRAGPVKSRSRTRR
jgi:hypothetical protein